VVEHFSPSNHKGFDGLFTIGYDPNDVMRSIGFRERPPMRRLLELDGRPLFKACPD